MIHLQVTEDSKNSHCTSVERKKKERRKEGRKEGRKERAVTEIVPNLM